jgi:hypothetical protein
MMTLADYVHLHGRNVTARRMRMSPAAITYMLRDKRDIFVVEDADRVEVWELKVLAEFATPGSTESDSLTPGAARRPPQVQPVSSGD